MDNSTKKKESEFTNQDALRGLDNPLIEAFENEGITLKYLTKKLKRELNAKETTDKRIAWKIRQEARKDAHKLRGDYPVERTDLSGEITLRVVYDAQLQGKEENAKTGS